MGLSYDYLARVAPLVWETGRLRAASSLLEQPPGPWESYRVWRVLDPDGEPRLAAPLAAPVFALPDPKDGIWPAHSAMGRLLEPGDRAWAVDEGGVHGCLTELLARRLVDESELWDEGGVLALGQVAMWGRRLPAQLDIGEVRFEFGYPSRLIGIEDLRGRPAARGVIRGQLEQVYGMADGSGLRAAVADTGERLRCQLDAAFGASAREWAYLPGGTPAEPGPLHAGGSIDLEALLAEVELLAGSRGRSRVHGWEHWRRVAAIGLNLAEATPGADPLLVLLFGLLHDLERYDSGPGLNERRSGPAGVVLWGMHYGLLDGHIERGLESAEGDDPWHGPRAARRARDLNGGPYTLSDRQLELLCFALEMHAEGLLSAEPTIACCWDADRLELWRVGIRPSPALLSTRAGRERIAWARTMEAPSWAELHTGL